MIITNILLVAVLVKEIIKENKCKKKKNVFVKGRDKILVADTGGGVSIGYEPGVFSCLLPSAWPPSYFHVSSVPSFYLNTQLSKT